MTVIRSNPMGSSSFPHSRGEVPRDVAESDIDSDVLADERHIRVMLAEDSDLIRDGLRDLFRREASIDVVGVVTDGRAALRDCGDLQPDVLVMELLLPKLHGVDLMRELAAACPGVRVVGLTNRLDPHQVWQAIESGVNGLLCKAVAFPELLRAVRLVSAGGVYLERRVQEALVRGVIRRGDHLSDRRLACLTGREREVAKMLVEGMTTGAIARDMYVSVKTVDSHRHHVLKKLGCRNVADLTRLAVFEGMTRVDR